MFQLHEHQVDAIAKLDTGKVLVGGVGSGKSIAALAYFTALDRTKKIVVITTAKKRDSGEWYEDAMLMSLRNPMTVDSWNNIKNYIEEDAYFIFDEQRIVGKGAWVQAFWQIAAKNDWILLSATPADTWMDLMPVFVANEFFRNQTEFNEQHVRWARFVKYPKVDGYYGEDILIQMRDAIYVEMPHQKTAERFVHMIEVPFNEEEQKLLWTDRWNFYENMPVLDAGELMRLLRRSTNSDPSRLVEIKKLVEKYHRVIVFYNHNYELDILRLLHTEMDIPLAEWNGHNHQDIPRGDRWVYLVQYQAGSEGWNCVSTNHVAFYSLPYSYRQFEQAHGRIDRINTPYGELHYWILKSRSIFDTAIWKSLGRKKNFQAGAFAKKAWSKPERKESRLMEKHNISE